MSNLRDELAEIDSNTAMSKNRKKKEKKKKRQQHAAELQREQELRQRTHNLTLDDDGFESEGSPPENEEL